MGLKQFEDMHFTTNVAEMQCAMDMAAATADPLLAQIGALWPKLDERGKRTIAAMAVTQAKLCGNT